MSNSTYIKALDRIGAKLNLFEEVCRVDELKSYYPMADIPEIERMYKRRKKSLRKAIRRLVRQSLNMPEPKGPWHKTKEQPQEQI